MPEAILHPDPQLFPIGTTVAVYLWAKGANPNATTGPALSTLVGAPAGSVLQSPVVAANGTLQLTGLIEGNTYISYASVGGKDHYLFVEVESAAVVGSGLNQTQVEELLEGKSATIAHIKLEGGGVELLKLRSSSTTAHAASIVLGVGTGVGNAALNVASENTEGSALQVTGVEEKLGTIKVTHTNPTATAGGDINAAVISIERKALVGSGFATTVQGIFMADNAATTGTGPWLTIRDKAKALMLSIISSGAIVFPKKTAATGSPAESGAILLDNENGHLYAVNSSGEAQQIDGLDPTGWKAMTLNAKTENGTITTAYTPACRLEHKSFVTRLRGTIKVKAGETVAAGETIFTLPAGTRPSSRVFLTTVHVDEGVSSSAIQQTLIVEINGEVKLGTGGSIGTTRHLLLDGLNFQTA